MPTLVIKTNTPGRATGDALLIKRASSLVAEILRKPESYVMIVLERPAAMCFGRDTSPLAFLELKSLGLPQDETPALSAALCELMQRELDIPPNRVYIEFASPPRHMFGFDARTF
jgi:phenylpyruvate tautomerase PptA (4-oxalocrotonate tautomerase family)